MIRLSEGVDTADDGFVLSSYYISMEKWARSHWWRDIKNDSWRCEYLQTHSHLTLSHPQPASSLRFFSIYWMIVCTSVRLNCDRLHAMTMTKTPRTAATAENWELSDRKLKTVFTCWQHQNESEFNACAWYIWINNESEGWTKIYIYDNIHTNRTMSRNVAQFMSSASNNIFISYFPRSTSHVRCSRCNAILCYKRFNECEQREQREEAKVDIKYENYSRCLRDQESSMIEIH